MKREDSSLGSQKNDITPGLRLVSNVQSSKADMDGKDKEQKTELISINNDEQQVQRQ